MRPVNNSTTGSVAEAGFWRWNSPLLYLFGGLALVLGLITVALIILACSFYRKYGSNSSSENQEIKQGGKQVEMAVDAGPKIVVIMAGDANPTYLAMAKPVSCKLELPK